MNIKECENIWYIVPFEIDLFSSLSFIMNINLSIVLCMFRHGRLLEWLGNTLSCLAIQRYITN